MASIFDVFKKAKSDLETRLKALRTDIEAKQRERDALRAAPAARADVKAALGAYIGTLGADYTTALSSTVATLARQPHLLAGMSQAPGKLLRTPILGAAEPMADHLSAKALDSAFAALFGSSRRSSRCSSATCPTSCARTSTGNSSTAP